MQWWNDFVSWVTSDTGWRVISTAIVPFVAIVVAGVVAAAIGRGSARRTIEQHDREHKASAVATLIGAGRKAAVWSSLSAPEKDHYENLASEAEVKVRLLPVSGSSLAADWAAHQLAEMKRNSASFSFQADQTLEEFRDRLIEWQHRPGRAKKLFRMDLERWRYDQPEVGDPLVAQQREWATAHAADAQPASRAAAPASVSTATVAMAPPASSTPSPSGSSAPSPSTTSPSPSSSSSPAAAPPHADDAARAGDDAQRAEREHAATTTMTAPSPFEAPAPVAASAVRQRISGSTEDDSDR